MSRHWVNQSDDHKGKVDRFCFNSNLAFIESLVCFGFKDRQYWTQIHKGQIRAKVLIFQRRVRPNMFESVPMKHGGRTQSPLSCHYIKVYVYYIYILRARVRAREREGERELRV